MGRVARYKKIKSFDPYSKENRGRVALERVGVWGLGDSGRKAKRRSLTSQKLRAKRGKKEGTNSGTGFDLPPPDEEDEFDSATMAVQKKRKPLSLDDVEASGRIESAKGLLEVEKEEKRINKKIEDQVEQQKKPPVPIPEKMPGESRNAFRKRVDSETRQVIRDAKVKNRNPEKKQKKKEFLKNKKLKKKGGSSSQWQSPSNESDDDDDLGPADKAVAARALDVPHFGEQAERPPELKLLPRGAAKKNHEQNAKKKGAGKKRKASGLDDEAVKAEQEAMELMRRKVQAQYALVRQKRRGDFHL